mgnify:FL=1
MSRFSYDRAYKRHIQNDNDWDVEEELTDDSQSPWEAAFEYGEGLAREEQAEVWDED